jgi:hypothetical protein
VGLSVQNSNLAYKMEEDPEKPHAKPTLTVIDEKNLANKMSLDPLDQILLKKTKREHIKDFGLVMACFFTLIAGYKLYANAEAGMGVLILSAVAASFYLLSAKLPRFMLPVFSAWMFFAGYLEKVMTFLILGLMWSVTFLPIGVIFRLIGKTTMTLKFDPSRSSYWEDCDNSRADFKLLERQY